jgi:predicted phage terminase large subunit-like protein
MSALLLRPPTLSEIRAERAERARGALSVYIRQAWPVIEPTTEYLHNWHIDAIAEYLEAVTAGQITRLLINMPPRYMKSIAVTIMWPTWEWLRKPSMRWMFASYSADLSTRHSVDRRRIIESAWYQERWGNVYQMTTDQNVKTEYENNRRGYMVATSVGGSSTGRGGGRIVVDDPHNPRGAESDTQRQATITYFDRTLSTRLDDKKSGAIVIVMQRLHEKDLSAHALELGYEHLSLPAEAEKRTLITLPSGREIVREAGDLLWTEREGPKELAEARKTLGSYGYAGQYQQQPSPTEGGIFKRIWWRFWHYPDKPLPPVLMEVPGGEYHKCPVMPLPVTFDEQLLSWDMAFKDLATSDYVVGQAWGRNGADKFLLDQVRERLDMPATVLAVKNLAAKWPDATRKLVEDKANGPAVISTLQHNVTGLIAVTPDGGKVARAQAVSPECESGNVYLPHPAIAPWVLDFIERFAKFPNVAFDDEIDTATQALNKMNRRRMITSA